jgi:hypothetical protein
LRDWSSGTSAFRCGAPSSAGSNKQVLAGILPGGLHDPSKMPDHYLDELRRVGRRPGYPTVARAIYLNLEKRRLVLDSGCFL